MILGPNDPRAIVTWVIETKMPSGEVKQFEGKGTFDDAVGAMDIAADHGAQEIRLGRPDGNNVEEVVSDFFAFRAARNN